MREINVKRIRDAVSKLCINANINLRKDILEGLKKAAKLEKKAAARRTLKDLIENACIASSERLPICQDTGMAVVFVETGQDVSLKGGDLKTAINDGVKDGYKKGFLRKSVVKDPIIRKNTNTNTPCVIHTDIVPGRRVRLTVLPKGFGSENKSRVAMLNPTAGIDSIKRFILRSIKEAGADACPPFVVGIGMGGTMDKAVELSKLALLRPLNKRNPKGHLAKLEKGLLGEINKTNIGPLGMGGKTTALGVSILSFPTHIAGLPVAVNISCHATRSARAVL